ncbi:hypothetical protein [Haloglomus litoreum]|uniref:hypothetical protein n=1 Tax=Haloglomus litoreum TaxID=3034026 RepID=UPI0023E78441|nr:hypothetical protein [Haloglomus sp. DT116]
MNRRELGVAAGVLTLLLAGSGLLTFVPAGPPARPMGSVPVTDCELVQLAVYELDDEPPGEFERERYDDLTDVQQRVFDEARATGGDFVRFDDESRMVAADTLPYAVVAQNRTYRANNVRGNCFDRPWYVGWAEPVGRVLVGLGLLLGVAVAWRRLTY